MLHEILLSLWGSSTSVAEIVETNPIRLDEYLHPGERALIVKILEIVKEVNSIRKFIQSYGSVDDSESQLRGLYLAALCGGIDKTLEPYKDEIVDMERIVLNDPYTPVSMILCRLQKYVTLFGVLNRICREVVVQKLHGCKILQCLHRHAKTGIPDVRKALEIITHSVHVVFYKHLTSWLLYGYLEDSFDEFFIQKIDKKSENQADRQDDLAETSRQFSREMWDYDINFNMLPYYIPASLAAKILTIGQTIIMFGNDPRQNRDSKFVENVENLIWGEKEFEFFGKFKILQAQPVFALVELSSTIDELKQCVTQHLWQVAVEEAQLINRLRLIKDFYLMGRGDLYLEFIKLSTPILDKVPTGHTSRDINLAFQVALRKISSPDESALDSFTFLVPAQSKDKREAAAKIRDPTASNAEISDREREDPTDKRGWGLIVLKYKVAWPLHILFNPVTLKNYNVLFRFLLRVKKTQISLWNLWRDHMNLKSVDIDLLQLRNNLIFIIDNLQYYLQVDVIESQYIIMENSMKNTRNFEDVQKAHAIFLADVMSRTFLTNVENMDKKNPVNKLIALLLRLCDDFICKASVWQAEKLSETEKVELKSLNDVLDGLMGWLNKTLNKVRAQPSGDHLAQLLLRLNFNKYFSNKNM